MEHSEKVKAIKFIRPGAEFVLRGNELDWLDNEQTKPTDEEIEAGFIAYQDALAQAQAEAQAKRQALLDKLGITEEEAKLLLG